MLALASLLLWLYGKHALGLLQRWLNVCVLDLNFADIGVVPLVLNLEKIVVSSDHLVGVPILALDNQQPEC